MAPSVCLATWCPVRGSPPRVGNGKSQRRWRRPPLRRSLHPASVAGIWNSIAWALRSLPERIPIVPEWALRAIQNPPAKRLDVRLGCCLVTKGPDVISGHRVSDNRTVNEVSRVGVNLLMPDLIDHVDGNRRLVLTLNPSASAMRTTERMRLAVLFDGTHATARVNADSVHFAPRRPVLPGQLASDRDRHHRERARTDQKLTSAQSSHASASSRANIKIAAR